MPGNPVHVVPRSGGWAIEQEGQDAIAETYESQERALEVAREIARSHQSELIIHDEDGQIRERDSYGNDPEASLG